MAKTTAQQVFERVLSTVGVVAGLVAVGVISWYCALATHLVARMSSGFFAA